MHMESCNESPNNDPTIFYTFTIITSITFVCLFIIYKRI